MIEYDFYVLEGRKVRKCASVHEYAESVADPKIKCTKVLDKIVSTIFLGFDRRMFPDNGKEPILFETMVFPDRTYARYQTYDEAINGHDKIVEKIKSKGAKVPVLLIDKSAREKIENIIDYAKKHPTKKSDLLKIKEGKMPPVGDNTKHSLILSGHYRIVYSREHQVDDRFYHHLSISVPGGKCPSVPSVEMIAEEFGMGRNMQSWDGLWMEEKAINVIKEISDEDNDL